MNKTVIVTDSTADIPADLVKQHNIHIVPLRLMFGEETYLDGVEIAPGEFYKKLVQSTQLPTTSQPSPADFVAVYESILEQYPGCSIVSLHISSSMSGTYQSALIATSMIEGDADITVWDSKSASYGFGLLVVEAAKLAQEGATASDIVASLEEIRSKRRLYFLVDTLEFLQKGGRIGKASAVLGTLLNIKPILSIDDEGVIFPVEKVRGRKKATAKIIELLARDLSGVTHVKVAVGHTADPAQVEEILQQLSTVFQVEETTLSEIGPVVGSHVGPGTIAAYVWPA
ncbi:DegV family protein [Paenibacillus sp. JCM 10914]|uniref:DegV family protein n=1 Tax=Paenibacillus sp. JCM 10914 TaxID=1236974 RepID=UPI0003CCAA86|nr:DegV family protein [Paenibacillus sp. JCM 10914]GAE04422.1 DegV family protein [Paenibacillus sp. JCM 10914]